MKRIQLPFFGNSITVCADSNDIYLQASYFDIPGFDAPCQGFITREGFIHYLAIISDNSKALIEWYRAVLLPASINLLAPAQPEGDMITFDGHSVNIINQNGVTYYKLNDILTCAGYAKNSALYASVDMNTIGIKSKGRTNQAWYVHVDGLSVIFANSEKAKKWLISFRLFLASKQIAFHQSVYYFLDLIGDIHTVDRKQLAANLCSLLKHYNAL